MVTTPQTPAPVMPRAAGAGPLIPDQAAAWIREHAWTGALRRTHRENPRYYQICACQSGLTEACDVGKCGRCSWTAPQRAWETIICGPDGVRPLAFPEPYAHLTDDSVLGRGYSAFAMVWLADRVCRWICPHPCHTVPAEPEAVQDALFPIGVTA